MELYYSYDAGLPADHLRPSFFYSYNRHDEINLNLGFAKAAYQRGMWRTNLALMGGTYSQYNLQREPGLLKNLMEANAGIKIRKNSNTWLDAGVMPSHIGFESAIGKDCWTLTRSILADNSPYFETGLRLSHTSKNEKVYMAALMLNGWQKIAVLKGDRLPAWGTQLTYTPDSNRIFNWSTFAGRENTGNIAPIRVYNNLFAQIVIRHNWSLIAGLDIGNQQKHDSSLLLKGWSVWYSPVLINRLTVSKKVTIALRGEYYSDKDRVMIAGPAGFGFMTLGVSANLDYRLRENVLWRIEGRMLSSPNEEFRKGVAFSRQNAAITSSLSVSF